MKGTCLNLTSELFTQPKVQLGVWLTETEVVATVPGATMAARQV